MAISQRKRGKKEIMKNIWNTKDIETPKSGLVVYKNSWWLCEDGDPAKALFYGDAPQCNQNKAICDHFMKKGLYQGKNLEVVFVETAFVPPRPD